jgi:hypothetical protein
MLGPGWVHVRQEDGRHEVAIVAEIKASSAPTANDAHHLAWLRHHVGDTFIAEVVLHTGPATYSLGEKLVAAPICTLWS